MKHLKTYKLFEHSNPHESIIDVISDICLEFNEVEIDYSIRTNIHYYQDGISGCDCIMISLKDNQQRFFTIDDIKDIILRLKDYLFGSNWHIDFGFPTDDTYLPLEDFLIEFAGEEMYDLNIYIYYKPQVKPIGVRNEDIKVPIKVGDTVLGGRFKNKKMVVKKIGKNSKGDITINDKPLLKFRLLKESNLDEFEYMVDDLMLDLKDVGLQVNLSRMRKDKSSIDKFVKDDKTDIYLEVYITRPYGSPDREMPGLPTSPGGKYPGNLFFWFEIKETITRLTEWYYTQTNYEPIDKNPNLYRWEKDESPLRFFGSGIEMFFGCTNQEDFEDVGDLISFTNFRIELKV